MKKLKKISFVLSCILLIMSITHYVLFPQETQCMLISFSTFEQKGGFYARKEIADTTRHKIAQIMLLAEKRVAAFWGERLAHPTYIYCENDADFAKYGGNPLSPASF